MYCTAYYFWFNSKHYFNVSNTSNSSQYFYIEIHLTALKNKGRVSTQGDYC